MPPFLHKRMNMYSRRLLPWAHPGRQSPGEAAYASLAKLWTGAPEPWEDPKTGTPNSGL